MTFNVSFKKFLLTGASLFMLIGVGTNLINTNVSANRTHIYRVYHHNDWQKGTPWMFHHYSNWISNYQINSKHKKDRYIRYETTLGKHTGVDFIPIIYNSHFHKPTLGSDESAFAGTHPYYKRLGKTWYRIASGSTHGLHAELNNTWDNYGGVALIHMYGYNHFNMWMYSTANINKNYYHQKKQYMGYFTRYPDTYKATKHALNL